MARYLLIIRTERNGGVTMAKRATIDKTRKLPVKRGGRLTKPEEKLLPEFDDHRYRMRRKKKIDLDSVKRKIMNYFAK